MYNCGEILPEHMRSTQASSTVCTVFHHLSKHKTSLWLIMLFVRSSKIGSHSHSSQVVQTRTRLVYQNCTAPGGMSNLEGSNFCPLKGEPSTSQPFFSMSCTFCGEKRFEHKYASLPLTKVTVPPRGLTETTLIFSSVSFQFHYSSVAELVSN